MAKNFSFANLFPGGRSKSAGRVDPKAQEDEDEEETSAQEDEEEEEASAQEEDEDEEASAQEDDEEDKEAQEDDEEDEDKAAAQLRGRRAERRRIASILSSDAVHPGNMAQAAELACGTDLSPKQAIAVLKTAPKPIGSSLAAAMAGRGPKPITTPAGGPAKGPSCADLMKKRFSKAS